MSEIETKDFSIKFYAKHASFARNTQKKSDWAPDQYYYTAIWGFDVEDKEYTTSNHRSKVSYYGSDMTKTKPGTYETEPNEKRLAEIKQAVFDFINKLMADVKIEARFSLQDKAKKN